MIDRHERAERTEKSEPADPIQTTPKNEPIEQIEHAEPIEPMERTEPFDAIERIEPSEAIDHLEVAPEASSTVIGISFRTILRLVATGLRVQLGVRAMLAGRARVCSLSGSRHLSFAPDLDPVRSQPARGAAEAKTRHPS